MFNYLNQKVKEGGEIPKLIGRVGKSEYNQLIIGSRRYLINRAGPWKYWNTDKVHEAVLSEMDFEANI